VRDTVDMRRTLLGVGLALALSVLGVATVPAAAYADSTCYTGCTPASPGNATTPPVSVSAQTREPSSGALAFTGADIEGLSILGASLVVVGGVLVRRSRRQARTAA